MPKKILIIDDDKDFVEEVSKILQASGYETESAYSGEEALEKLGSGKYHMVTLDIMMPGKDGFEVLREIRSSEDEAKKDIPVVVISTLSEDSDVFKVYSKGADYHLPKPFKMEKIVYLTDYLIGNLTAQDRKVLEWLI